MQIDASIDRSNPRIEQLVTRVKQYYEYLEDKEFGSIYHMLSAEFIREEWLVNGSKSESVFVKYCEEDTPYGVCNWRFISLGIRSIISKDNIAFVKTEYSIRENRETTDIQYFYDRWMYINGEWMILSIWDDIPGKGWPKD